MVALSVAGDTPDGPSPDPKDRQLRLPKAVLYRAWFRIYGELVDARANNDAHVCHGPSHVAVNLAGDRPRSSPFVRLVALRHLSGVGSLFGALAWIAALKHRLVRNLARWSYAGLIMAYKPLKPLVRGRFRT